MIKINQILCTLLLIIFSCTGIDRIDNSANAENKDNFLELSILETSFIEDTNKVVLQIKFPVNKLIFKKESDKFSSNITIDLLVVGENNKIVLSNSWNERIVREYYDDTKSLQNIELIHEINLNSGDYKFNVIINDFENHINWMRSSDFKVEKNVGLSSISFFYKDKGSLKISRLFEPVCV